MGTTPFNPNRPIEHVRFLRACRYLTSDILEGMVGYVKENETGMMPTGKHRWTGRDENNLENLFAA